MAHSSKEYMKDYMRDYRARKKVEIENLKLENQRLKDDLINLYTKTLKVFMKLRSQLKESQELVRAVKRMGDM